MKQYPTLSSLSQGSSAIILKLNGGEQFRQKMHGMGLRKGMNIKVVQGSQNHPFLIDVDGSHIALGWGMTEKIIIRA